MISTADPRSSVFVFFGGIVEFVSEGGSETETGGITRPDAMPVFSESDDTVESERAPGIFSEPEI